MAGLNRCGLGLFLVFAIVLCTSARYSNQVTGLDSATFEGREVLVIRTSGYVSTPSGYKRDVAGSTVRFLLRGVGADSVAPFVPSGELISGVSFEQVEGEGVNVVVALADNSLVDGRLFRLSQPSDHVILFEVFPGSEAKHSARMITDLAGQLGINMSSKQGVPVEAGLGSSGSGFDPDKLGITSIDLSQADPQRVLGLASATGLLDIKATAWVTTEKMGTVVVKPAGLSLASWGLETPPSVLFLSGTPKQLADFLSRANPDTLATQPTFSQVWEANKPKLKLASPSKKRSSGRGGVRSDPYAGLYVKEEPRKSSGRGLLSDIRVSLPAMNGLHLYDVLHYLSMISGISIIIDPYTFDDPTGMRRDPLPPDSDGEDNSGPGFRSAGVFNPTDFRPGTVMGNFDNVPFDTALRLILETHGLEYVVYDSQSSRVNQGGGRKVTTRGGNNRSSSGYDKPIILITSPERLEQELSGQNEVDLLQFHYADPYQIEQILDNLNLRTSSSGWYIYRGGGGGGGRGGGGRGGGGGGTFSASAKGGLLVYRGSTRNPVYRAVSDAVAQGDNVIRVVLAPSKSGQLVTAFASK